MLVECWVTPEEAIDRGIDHPKTMQYHFSTTYEDLLAKYGYTDSTNADMEKVYNDTAFVGAMRKLLNENDRIESLTNDYSTSTGLCEVCTYVITNKEQHQPYLCRGLADPSYQKACVQTMESIMWWLTNVVYWVNYGCQHQNGREVEWVRPCPAHAVCGWIEELYLKKSFCPTDPDYPTPV